MGERAMTGAEVLEEQYAGTGRLHARQSLWDLRSGPPLRTVVLDRAGLAGTESVVDVGCGNGIYLAELRRRGHVGPVLGIDRSVGMAGHSRAHAATAVADAQALPLKDGSVDVVLSLHMLYHVPDVPKAVAELRRVLRPGGTAMVTTNGPGHSAEAKRVLLTAAQQVAGLGDGDLDWDNRRFSPAVARQVLGAVFDDVDEHLTGDAVHVPDPAVVAEYIASWPPESIGLTEGPQWQEIVAATAGILSHHESFTVTSQVAVYRCS